MAHRATGTKIVCVRAIVAISLKCISSCPAFTCQTSGKRAVSVLNDCKVREWENVGNLSLKRHSQRLKEALRVQDPVQVYRQTTYVPR